MSQSPSHAGRQASQSDSDKNPVLLDTDIGDNIDDALALALALHSPEIELQGVTTVSGDTYLRACLAQHLLRVFGRDDIPVAAGVSTPLQVRHRPTGVPQAAILNPCEDANISSYSGPELIVQKATAYPGRLTLICVGPLTNVATALLIEPRLFMTIRSIVMMGGSSGIPWLERNVRSDVKAAQIVLAAGIPITLLGLNITRRCQLLPGDIERLRYGNSPQTRLLYQLLRVWQRHRGRWQPPYPYLHDPLTIAALCAPEFLRFEEMTARVTTHGPFQGFMMSRFLDGPLVRAAVGIRADEAREWVMRRLLQ